MIDELLTSKGVKPTANRILVAKALHDAPLPYTLSDLENLLPTLDKSSIFRVLTLFLENDIVHSFEDGRGVVNYELCHAHGACDHHDQHLHFYCNKCHRSFCLQNIDLASLTIPQGFIPQTLSFVIKGTCPHCS